MNYISTTDLRTKSTHIVNTLKSGESLYLVHRSKVVGEIKPTVDTSKLKRFNAKKFLKLVKQLNLPPLSDEERERNYREHIEKKYGKRFS